ncbi:MAG: DUF47 family protein [Tetrasphaera sp.]|jgi:uncharacterized protein Yka (UPF0111/DUF47 family)|nr:DUF47 family protein [Tetrasphaera sp.]
MALRLARREPSFHGQFVASAGLLLEASRALTSALASERKGRAEAVALLRDLEQRHDEVRHEIVRLAASAFVTPFARADIHALSIGLDECMDFMASSGDLLDLFSLTDLPKGVGKQVEILGRMAEITVRAMPTLIGQRAAGDFVVEINRLENEADRVHRRLLAKVLDASPKELPAMLRIRAVVDELEKAANAFETVAHVVEGMTLEEF